MLETAARVELLIRKYVELPLLLDGLRLERDYIRLVVSCRCSPTLILDLALIGSLANLCACVDTWIPTSFHCYRRHPFVSHRQTERWPGKRIGPFLSVTI